MPGVLLLNRLSALAEVERGSSRGTEVDGHGLSIIWGDGVAG